MIRTALSEAGRAKEVTLKYSKRLATIDETVNDLVDAKRLNAANKVRRLPKRSIGKPRNNPPIKKKRALRH